VILHALSATLGTIYIPLLAAGSIVTASRKASIRRLTIGLRVLGAAAAVEASKLLVNLLALPGSGQQAVLSAACLVLVSTMLVLVAKRRRWRGEQVVAEAEKTVRDWRISRASVYVAHVFPRLPGEPDGLWYARLYGEPARPCRDRQAAVDHIIRALDSRRIS
jgi:hypothetical protein